jgi:hypothetical protein
MQNAGCETGFLMDVWVFWPGQPRSALWVADTESWISMLMNRVLYLDCGFYNSYGVARRTERSHVVN